MEEERAEEGRAKVFEGAEYPSSFCHAKDQAGERGGTGGTLDRIHGSFTANFVGSYSLGLCTGGFNLKYLKHYRQQYDLQ